MYALCPRKRHEVPASKDYAKAVGHSLFGKHKKALGPDAGEPWQYTLPERIESKGAVGDAAYFDESADTMFIPVDGKPGEYIENHNLFVFSADRQPDPFTAQYTKESVVEEFRKKLGRYLPDGFDYMAHIGFFTCTVYYR